MRFYLNQEEYIDTSKPIDISIEMTNKALGLVAWGQDAPKMEPVRDENFIGSIKEGGVVNFNNIMFNPHAHITHTECCGHITKDFFSINDVLKTYFFEAQLITMEPEGTKNKLITLNQIKEINLREGVKALVIRTLPNKEEKLTANYTNTNPPFLDVNIANYLINKGVEHLLVDLPSVDQERDEGELAFHHAFWNVPLKPNTTRTITEFIYVPDDVCDGNYILELQVSPMKNDASPSRPVLYHKMK
ncbi:MAG: cyclase family protein [Flavobacteriales bacterium]|nr:MAG: cyclase family protein [Flavobacteriales bacterium]